MTGERLLLLGCGVLRAEIRFLVSRNAWPLDMVFLRPELHADIEALSRELSSALAQHRQRDVLVFYGACHPLMEQILAAAQARRTPGQNCLEMLLGRETFDRELAGGAYFLLEETARRWQHVVSDTFGGNQQVMQEIFQGSHSHILCVRTPCSGDFTAAAAAVGGQVGLPLHWLDVTLDHLESVLSTAIFQPTEPAS